MAGRKSDENGEKVTAAGSEFYHKSDRRNGSHFFDQFLFCRTGKYMESGTECADVFDIRIAGNTWGLSALRDSVFINFGRISQKSRK